jgi:hypothetical protein
MLHIKNSIYSVLGVFGLIISTFFFLYKPILAQSNQVPDKNIKCLNSSDGNNDIQIAGVWDEEIDGQSRRVRHEETSGTRNLTGEFDKRIGTVVYAVACQAGATGRICTTGDAAIDALIFGDIKNVSAATGQISVVFSQVRHTSGAVGDTGPDGVVNTSSTIGIDGIVNVIATISVWQNVEFYGIEVTPHIDPIVEGADTGNQSALHQAQLEFQKMIETSNAKNCAKINWVNLDPYGVVFDSISLEPLSDVVVTIHNESGIPVANTPVLQNGLSTPYDGVYNYLVEPGKYLLTFAHPKYKFSTTQKTNRNMSAIYDFIDENEAKSHCTIYKPNEIIDEKINQPECRNIPLEPIDTPQIKEPLRVKYEYLPNLAEGIHTVKGKVTHPLAIATAYQILPSAQKIEIALKESNHSGFYKLDIPVENIFPGTAIEIAFKKSTLMTTQPLANNFIERVINMFHNIYIKNIFAQENITSQISIDPIPVYIEGYAYDKYQKIIPSAMVQVRIKNGGGIYYQTKANKNGYFFIPANNLPTSMGLEYSLVFNTPSGKQISYKLYEFTKVNRDFFSKEKINLLTGKKNGEKPVPQAPEKTELVVIPVSNDERIKSQQRKTFFNANVSTPLEDIKKEISTTNPVNQQIILIIILLIVLGIVGIAAVVITKKNSSPTNY